jgi:hypothetical protein
MAPILFSIFSEKIVTEKLYEKVKKKPRFLFGEEGEQEVSGIEENRRADLFNQWEIATLKVRVEKEPIRKFFI